MSANQCVICQRSTDAFLCWEDTRRLKEALESVPWLDENLEVTVLRQDKLGKTSDVKSKDSEKPLAFNDHVSTFRRGLRDTLTRWVRDLCDSRGVTFKHIDCECTHPATFVGPLRQGERRERCHLRPITTPDLSAWLAHNVVAIMHSEDAQLCYEEIADPKVGIVAQGVKLINRPEPPVYRGPCPTVIGEDRGRPIYCATDLYADKGSAFAKCPRCKSDHDVYKIEQNLLGEMDGILMSAAEILRVTRELGEPISRDRFFRWVKDAALLPRAWRHDGRITDHKIGEKDSALYRLGDVRLLRRETGTEKATG